MRVGEGAFGCALGFSCSDSDSELEELELELELEEEELLLEEELDEADRLDLTGAATFVFSRIKLLQGRVAITPSNFWDNGCYRQFLARFFE